MAKNRVVVEFPKKLDYVMLGLYTKLSSLNVPPGMSQKEYNVFCGQTVNYLLGEGLVEPRADLPLEDQQLIKSIQPVIPEQAKQMMLSVNKEFRQIIVYTLRMRLYVNQMLHGTDWLDTPVGKNVWALLQDYGSEFPEQVSAKMFDEVVARVAH